MLAALVVVLPAWLAACQSDASEDLAVQIGTAAAKLRASTSTELTFKYLPKGCRGDFSIMVGPNKIRVKPTGTALVVDCTSGGSGGILWHLLLLELTKILP